MKSALITGSRGFVGRHIEARLLADGWETIGIDIKNGRGALGADCRDYFSRSSHRFDLVVHCAAIVGGRATIEGEPMSVATDLAIDSDFFNFVLRSRPAHAVYFSSSAAYPTRLQSAEYHVLQLGEDCVDLVDVAQPDAVYGWVKLTGEQLAQYANAEGANIQVYRPFSGYGTDQDRTYPFPTFIDRAVRRCVPFDVWGPGTQVRDWIHISDVVESVIAGLDYEEQIGPANLCTGIGLSMSELIGLAWESAGWPADELQLLPRLDAPTGVMHRVGDPGKMLEKLAVPRVPIADGVATAVHVAASRG